MKTNKSMFVIEKDGQYVQDKTGEYGPLYSARLYDNKVHAERHVFQNQNETVKEVMVTIEVVK